MSSKTVADRLDKLAKALLEDALSTNMPPGSPSRLDIFKAVSAYHIGSTRATKGQTEDDGEGSSFQDLRRGLESLGKPERSN